MRLRPLAGFPPEESLHPPSMQLHNHAARGHAHGPGLGRKAGVTLIEVLISMIVLLLTVKTKGPHGGETRTPAWASAERAGGPCGPPAQPRRGCPRKGWPVRAP